MPREGTKTNNKVSISNIDINIEIRYAPGGDENIVIGLSNPLTNSIEIRYAPGGDENDFFILLYADRGILRLDMPREGTKT